ncbi:MAG TPA: threonine synthase [Vicinamibacterales bacterium]|jgi:threonine synthase
MTFRAELRCASGCSGAYPFDAIVHRCPACGGLMEVVHDLDALRSRSAADWKALFETRALSAAWPYTSGVWNRKEWVAPSIRDEHIVSMGEGSTPLVPAGRLGAAIGLDDLWIKQCGTSHTASFKDLGMTVLVSTVKQMIADGRRLRAVACASTGDTSAALAAYAAAAGIPAIVILPRGKVTRAQLVQPLANGATVLALGTDFDGCMTIIERLAVEEGLYLANSLNSLRLEGQKTVAFEIAQQCGWQAPDVVVVPGGNLGNVSALFAGFELLRTLGLTSRLPRLVVGQTEAANPLYRAFVSGWRFEPVAAQPTHASAIQIGNPVSFPRAMRALQRCDGLVEQASERELSAAAVQADAAGFFTCPQTSVALAAVTKLVARGAIGRHERVVVLSTASGLKFVDFKLTTAPNAPIELPGDYDAVRRALETAVPA